jgi:outer membrane protein TolC
VLAVLLGLVAGPLPAQSPARRLTLEQALQIAVNRHPSLVRTDAQTAAARARIEQARAGTMPVVALQGAATDGPSGAPAFGPIGNPANFGALPMGVQGLAGDPLKKQFGGGLNISLTIFDFGRTQYLVGARRNLYHAAQEDAETQKALVLLTVEQAYLNVLRAQQLVSVQQADLRQRDATVTQARALVEGQLRSGVELQLAQADRAAAAGALAGGQNDLRYAFAALNNALGDTSLTPYQLDDAGQTLTAAPPAATVAPIEQILQRALAQRPEVRSLRLQREGAEQAIHGVRSELMPRLDGIASIGVVNPGASIHNDKDYAIGVAITVPLFTGGAVEGRIAEEKERRAALAAQEREVSEMVKLQVTRAWLDVQSRAAQVAAAQAQVAAAGSSVQLAGERYRLQLSTIVELTEAEAADLRARAQLVEATYDLLLSRAVLSWAAGDTYGKYSRTAARH